MFLINVLIVTGIIMAIAAILTIVCRDTSHFRGLDRTLDQTLFGAFFQRLYFTLTTLTTIGLGDISPATLRAKVVVMLMIFCVLVVILKSLDDLMSFVKDAMVKKLKPQKPKEETQLPPY
jgi:hypothetical protein